MTSQITGAPEVAIHVYQALYGQAPGNAEYLSYVDQIGTSNGNDWAAQMVARFSTMSDSAFATLVMANLGLSDHPALHDPLMFYFGAAGIASRGTVVIQLSEIISNLVGDATWGADAVDLNAQTMANFNYSSDPAHTSPASPVPSAGQTFTLTTGADNVIGTAGPDTINGVVNYHLVGYGSTYVWDTSGTTLNVGDVINGGAGVDTLKLLVSSDGYYYYGAGGNVDLRGVTISNVEKLVVYDVHNSIHENSYLGSNDFTSVTLQNFDDSNVYGIKEGTAIIAQAMPGTTYNWVNTYSDGSTAASITINDTFQGDPSATDGGADFSHGDEGGGLANATAINATLNLLNANSARYNYDWADQYIYANNAGNVKTAITLNVNVQNATSDGTEYSGTDTYVYQNGDAVVTANVNIANSDSVEVDVYADDNGNGTVSPTNVANVTLNNVTNSDYSEVYLSDFGTINVTVSGKSTLDNLNTYANEGAAFTSQTLNIVANADLTLSGTDTADTGSDSVIVSGAGNVNLGYYDGTYTALSATVTDVINASALTGGLTVEVGEPITSVTSGSGNDSITLDSGAFGAISTGAGNDKVTLKAAPAAKTTIDGGAGTDTLAGVAAVLAGISADTTATKVAITNFEGLEVTDALGANNIDTTGIQTGGLSVITLDNVAGAGLLTFAAGASTLNLKAALSGAINVASAGKGAADSVTIVNATKSVNVLVKGVQVATSQDAFGGGAVTAAGVETLTFNGTGTGAAKTQTVGDITITSTQTATTPTATYAPNAVNFVGSNSFTTGVISAGNAGVLTVDASGLTGAAALNATVTGATTITGSAGNDVISFNGSAANATVNLGAGNDIFNLVTHGAGTLTVNLGDGNDSFTVAAGQSINATDVIDGGAGTDSLTLQYVGAANIVAFKNFEVFDAINLDHTLDVAILASNNTVTEIISSGAVGTNAILTNLGAGVNFRATGDMGSTNALTLTQATGGALTVTLNHDSTSTIAANPVNLDVHATNATALTAVFNSSSADKADTALNLSTIYLTADAATSLAVSAGGTNATDVLVYNDTAHKLASVTVTGAQNLDLTALSGTTALTSINASAFTGNLTVDLGDMKVNAGALTLGSGVDTVLLAAAASNATGGDSITNFGKAAAATTIAVAAADQLVIAGASSVLADGAVTNGTVSHGVLTWTGAGPTTFAGALAIADAATATAGTAVEFQYLSNSYVYVNDGTANATAADTLVKLVGVTGVTNLAEVGGLGDNHFAIV